MIASYRKPQCDARRLASSGSRLYTQTSSCHGPAGRAPAGGDRGRGVSAKRIPRGTPPNLARRGEVATKRDTETQTNSQLRHPAEPCAPAGPLRSFSDVCGGGVVRTDHHNAGETKWEHPLNNTTRRPSTHLLVAAKAQPSQVRHLPLPPHWSE
jgi:hypothetical protein